MNYLNKNLIQVALGDKPADAVVTGDAAGKYIAPGLIDAHLHAEVPKITFTRLANAVVERGTTSVMTPLDQMGVVNGIDGMRWVLDEAKKTPLKVFHSCPSRLPYTTPASTIAFTFGPKEHAVAQKWEEAASKRLGIIQINLVSSQSYEGSAGS